MNQKERPFMKTESDKSKKQRQTKSLRNKPICGTLSYLAECRGTVQKDSTARITAPPGDMMSRIIRRYPAAS